MSKLKVATKTGTSSVTRIAGMTGMILGASAVISLILTWMLVSK
ncbi:MAG: hypothetical protein BWY53_00502 [Parcubacteria group bacterium ADurb.Bin326]|nr:MAG: hypothetical protein BWY53_00502 [Parcubacteria group bacterium ADurb.Bin326]